MTGGRMMRRVATLLLCGGALVGVAACGDDDDDAGSAGTAPADTSGAGLSQATIDYGVTYTGGKAGAADANAKPFVVGWVNQQGSTPSYPEMEAGADAAVKFINEHLGGMAGRPLKLDKCAVQSEEDGQKCAAQALNNPDVMSVQLGNVVNGNKPFHDAVAGKLPVFVGFPGASPDFTTPGVRELDGGSLATLTAMVQDVEKVGAKTLALVSSPNPAGKFTSEEILKPQLDKKGVKTTIIYVPDDGTAPDYVSALQASGAPDADVLMIIPAHANACAFLYDGLKQLGASDKKVIATYYCYGDPMPERTGGGAKNWDFFGPASNQHIDNEQSRVFTDVMKTYTDDKLTFTGSPQRPFGDLLTLAKFVNAVGPDITKEQIVEQARAFRGPMFMVDGTFMCDANTEFIGACGDSSSGSTYDGEKYVSLGAFKVVEFGEQRPTKDAPLPVPVMPASP